MLFETLASGSLGSLLNTVIVNTVNVLATFIAVAFVDKWGRRFLLMATAAWMCLLLVIVAIVLGVGFGKYGEAHSILPCPPKPFPLLPFNRTYDTGYTILVKQASGLTCQALLHLTRAAVLKICIAPQVPTYRVTCRSACSS